MDITVLVVSVALAIAFIISGFLVIRSGRNRNEKTMGYLISVVGVAVAVSAFAAALLPSEDKPAEVAEINNFTETSRDGASSVLSPVASAQGDPVATSTPSSSESTPAPNGEITSGEDAGEEQSEDKDSDRGEDGAVDEQEEGASDSTYSNKPLSPSESLSATGTDSHTSSAPVDVTDPNEPSSKAIMANAEGFLNAWYGDRSNRDQWNESIKPYTIDGFYAFVSTMDEVGTTDSYRSSIVQIIDRPQDDKANVVASVTSEDSDLPSLKLGMTLDKSDGSWKVYEVTPRQE